MFFSICLCCSSFSFFLCVVLFFYGVIWWGNQTVYKEWCSFIFRNTIWGVVVWIQSQFLFWTTVGQGVLLECWIIYWTGRVLVIGHFFCFLFFPSSLFFSFPFLLSHSVYHHSSLHNSSLIPGVKDVGLIRHKSDGVAPISCTSCKRMSVEGLQQPSWD